VEKFLRYPKLEIVLEQSPPNVFTLASATKNVRSFIHPTTRNFRCNRRLRGQQAVLDYGCHGDVAEADMNNIASSESCRFLCHPAASAAQAMLVENGVGIISGHVDPKTFDLFIGAIDCLVILNGLIFLSMPVLV